MSTADKATDLAMKYADEIKRLRAAGDAAFYAMCAQRDTPDDEAFQVAIDALGMALSRDKQ